MCPPSVWSLVCTFCLATQWVASSVLCALCSRSVHAACVYSLLLPMSICMGVLFGDWVS